MESNLKLNQLRDFVAVATAGGIRPATRQSGQAQPALTKSIQQLERALGVPLFARTGKRLVLTDFGRALLQRARAVLNDVRRAEQEIHLMRTQRDGEVSFSMGGINLMALLPGALATFRRRYGEVTVRAMERPFDQALNDLRHGDVEFAVLPDMPEPLGDGFSAATLHIDQCAVIARRGHPKCKAGDMAELLDQSWIMTRQGALKSATFERQFQALGLPVPHVAIQCESIAGVLSLLEHSDYLAILPKRWLRPAFVRAYTQEIPIGARLLENHSYIVRRSDLPLSPAAAAFVASLEVEARSM
jgi:DNA-binding transcriptional LysR family regulator